MWTNATALRNAGGRVLIYGLSTPRSSIGAEPTVSKPRTSCVGDRARTDFTKQPTGVQWLAIAGLLFSFGVTSLAAQENGGKTMQLSSAAFKEGGPIPPQYTCDGRNVSPSLKWSGVPQGAKSLVLLVDDPDAPVGIWVHWVLYDLPPGVSELPEDVPQSQYVPQGAKQGLNDFKRLGYGGPCPPSGKAHRYFFKLYALDITLDLKPGATKTEVEHRMTGHILAQGQLMGTYQRK